MAAAKGLRIPDTPAHGRACALTCTGSQISHYAARIQRLQALAAASPGVLELQADVAQAKKQCALLRRKPWLCNVIPLLTPCELDAQLAAEMSAETSETPAQPETPAETPAEMPEMPGEGLERLLVPVPPIALHELLEIVMGAEGGEAAAAALAQLREQHACAPGDGLSVLAAEAWLDDLVSGTASTDCRGGGDDGRDSNNNRAECVRMVLPAATEPVVLPSLRDWSTP